MLITSLDKVKEGLQMTAELVILLEIKLSSFLPREKEVKYNSTVSKAVHGVFSMKYWKVT